MATRRWVVEATLENGNRVCRAVASRGRDSAERKAAAFENDLSPVEKDQSKSTRAITRRS